MAVSEPARTTRAEIQKQIKLEKGVQTEIVTLPSIAQGVTRLVPFEVVKELLENSPPPRRPNRNRPIHDGGDLNAELAAWDRASDEAWSEIE
jgi:hypothetical protein